MNLIKSYCKNFSGVPLESWQRILLTFVNDMATGVALFMSLYFVNVLHFNVATAGLILSCYGIGTAVGGMLGGKLTDKFSPNLITGICLIVEAVVFLELINTSLTPLLAVLEFILGVATYTFGTANKVCVLTTLKGNEAIELKVLSLFYGSSNLGLGVSAVCVSWLASYGFSSIFLLSSSVLIISALYLVLIKKRHTEAKTISAINAEKNEEISVINNNINHSVFWLILLCLFTTGLIIAQLSSTYSVYLTETFPELGVNAVSMAFTLNAIMIILLQTPVVNFFNKQNKIVMVGVGAVLMASGMALLNVAFDYSVVITSMVVYTLGEMIFFSMAQLVVYQHSDQNKKGQSLGLFQSTYAMSVIVGPMLGGYIYHNLGASMIWYGSGIVGLFCLLITYSYKAYDLTEQY